MPIKGLGDTPRFPQIGVLRKGAPKQEKRPGSDLDHFRFDTDCGDAAATFLAAYGERPQQINILLPYSSVDENWHSWYELYHTSQLIRRCDGEHIVQARYGGARYIFDKRDCICDPNNRECRPTGRLMVMIPELKRLAYVVVPTTSIHDIITLGSSLRAIYLVAGKLNGIPMLLSRRLRSISTPDHANPEKRARRQKWLIHIEVDHRWAESQLDAIERRALADSMVIDDMPQIIDSSEGIPMLPDGGLFGE